MPDYERNLVLVHTKTYQARSDFETIRAKLAERAPDIGVFIVENGARHSVTRRQAGQRPTLVFSPVALREFRPARGRVLAGRRQGKMKENRRMAAAGLRVPEAVMLEPDTVLDPRTWGPFTILKPEVGFQGAGVRLSRTRDVRWTDPRSWPRDDPRFGVPLVAQKFIDTGEHATSFRVMTVLGRVIYSVVSRSSEARSFKLDPDGEEPLDEPVASNAGERTMKLNYDPTILAFARQVAAAFPEIPSLGIDIVREEKTRRLYCLEVNASGFTWHISSDYGLGHQRRHNLDLPGQFGALDVIADALIEATRREAI